MTDLLSRRMQVQRLDEPDPALDRLSAPATTNRDCPTPSKAARHKACSDPRKSDGKYTNSPADDTVDTQRRTDEGHGGGILRRGGESVRESLRLRWQVPHSSLLTDPA
jgi:hypothetical protein